MGEKVTNKTIPLYKFLSEVGKGDKGEVFANFSLALGPILDVRSPVEFEKGHIPDALNFPLFTDDERAKIGICYKTKGKDEAIELGFDIVGPRLGKMVRKAKKLVPDKTVRLHCARGGFRSKSVTWLLKTAGFKVSMLGGGYKSYRRWVREIVRAPRHILLLNGFTGTGKTRILRALREQGEQVLDLEGLANHRGSSFGGLGMPPQPTTQQFENFIAEKFSDFDSTRAVWIEAESGKVGNCWVPEELYRRMKAAPMVAIRRPLEERLDILTEMYGQTSREDLIEATTRIARNLGGERTKAAVELIRKNEIRDACRIILDYYDRTYGENRKRRPAVIPEIDVRELSFNEAASLLIEKASHLNHDLVSISI